MSVENLKEYARRCATEPEMRQAAKDIGWEDIPAHRRRSESLGLEWDMRDMADFRNELTQEEGFENLDEEDLDKIAGGVCTVTAVIVGSAVVGSVVAGAGAGAAVTGKAW